MKVLCPPLAREVRSIRPHYQCVGYALGSLHDLKGKPIGTELKRNRQEMRIAGMARPEH